jgi:KDO2-lipid IV(A) lauroyltransferase
MGNIGFYLLRSFTWLVQLLPLRFYFVVSDLVYLVIYYILRYRRKVVTKNLANSFPDKSEEERALIARKFYRHLCDTIFEIFYFDRISEKEGRKCVTCKNPELLNEYLDQGRQVLAFCGHYNNWELNCNLPLYTRHRVYAVYKKIKNPSFERFYCHLRGRFGVVPLERADTFKQLYRDHHDGVPSMSALLSDQTPRKFEIQHWITFLNQDTPVLLGTEKIAHKLDAVVLFLYLRKVKRGQYESEFGLVTDQARQCAPFEITDRCNSLLEQQIILQPEFWLWSHKRWKHKRG